MLRRLLAILLCVMMAVTLFAACGGSQKAGDAEKQPESSEAKAEESKTSAAGSGGEKVKITFWKWIPTEDAWQMPALEKAFEEENPNVDLEVTHIGESGAYFQKISAALPTGEGPDVVAMQVGANANQYKAFLEPLAPYAERTWGNDWRSKFLDVALEQCGYSGQEFYVLPGGMTAVPVVKYNVTLFEKHGLKPPTTLDELKNVIAVLKEKEPGVIPGVGMGAKEGWNVRDAFMGIINQVAPGKVYKAEAGEIPWTDPDIIKAFEIWKKLYSEKIYIDGALGQGVYPDTWDMFQKGKVAMFSIGTWHLSALTKNAYASAARDNIKAEDIHWGMFPYPSLVEGAEPSLVATVDIAWGMNKDSKQKDAVWKFIEFMTVGNGQTIWANTLQVLPSAKGIDLSAAKESLAGPAEVAALEMSAKYVENNAGSRELKYPELQNALMDALQSVAAGSKTPQAACDDVEKASKTTRR